MPKKLFFKLSDEKRQRILDAAAEEFIQYKDNYEKASIKRIAERADIAIGSMYKYFEDKNDLLMHLFDLSKKRPEPKPSSETLLEYSSEELDLSDGLDKKGKTFLNIILSNRELLHALIFGSSGDDPYNKQIEDYIEMDKQRGLIREEVDTHLAAYLYSSIELIAYDYCQWQGLDYSDAGAAIDKLIDTIFFGIYKNKP